MIDHLPTWLANSLIYLSAAVIAVPLARAVGLGSIIGYLGAGIAIGPWGLGLVTNAPDILHFAEFGVVLMLFLVGLELEPQRLWNLRRPIFGWGTAQVLSCAALVCAVAMALGAHGVPLTVALTTGIAFHAVETCVGLTAGLASGLFLLELQPARRWTVAAAGAAMGLAVVAAFSATVLVDVL